MEAGLEDRIEIEQLLRAVTKPRHLRAIIGKLEGETLAETAKVLGVTQERVRQMQIKSMRLMRLFAQDQGNNGKA